MTLRTKQRLASIWFAIMIVVTTFVWCYFLTDAVVFILTFAAYITGFIACLYVVIVAGEHALALLRIMRREVIAMRRQS